MRNAETIPGIIYDRIYAMIHSTKTRSAAKLKFMSARLRYFRFYSVRFYFLFLCVVLLLVGLDYGLSKLPFVEPIPDYADDLRKKQVESWTEMIKLLIALATLSIGAITGFVVNRDKSTGLTPPQIRRVLASWILCGASLYFGYLSYQQGTWMLSQGVFNPNPDNLRLWLPTRAQFWTFLISIVVFADYIYSGLQKKPPSP